MNRCPAGPIGMFFCACCVPCWTKVAARGPPAPSTDTHQVCKSKLESPLLPQEGNPANPLCFHFYAYIAGFTLKQSAGRMQLFSRHENSLIVYLYV